MVVIGERHGKAIFQRGKREVSCQGQDDRTVALELKHVLIEPSAVPTSLVPQWNNRLNGTGRDAFQPSLMVLPVFVT